MLWLRVLIQRRRLDRLLAEGSRPATNPRLALRARQLTRPDRRARLAYALRNARRSLDRTAVAKRRSPKIPVDAASVRACTAELSELARALTDIHARARGVAITRALLTDGAGPLYVKGQRERLRNTLLTALAAL